MHAGNQTFEQRRVLDLSEAVIHGLMSMSLQASSAFVFQVQAIGIHLMHWAMCLLTLATDQVAAIDPVLRLGSKAWLATTLAQVEPLE